MHWREHPLNPYDGTPCVLAASVVSDEDDEVRVIAEHNQASDEFLSALSRLSPYYEKTPAPLAFTRTNVWTEDARPRSVASRLPKDLGHSGEYTSIQVSQHNGLIPHQDASNMGPSFIIATGNYSRGRLWLQDDDGDQPPPCLEESLPHVQALKGKFVDVREKLCVFDGKGFTALGNKRWKNYGNWDTRVMIFIYHEHGQEPLERAVKLVMNAAQGGNTAVGGPAACSGSFPVQGSSGQVATHLSTFPSTVHSKKRARKTPGLRSGKTMLDKVIFPEQKHSFVWNVLSHLNNM
eukprot:1526738-Amphidinium_carterae.2